MPQDESGKPDVTRRATLKLATAVASFGAALGMRATSASAEQSGDSVTTKQKAGKYKEYPAGSNGGSGGDTSSKFPQSR